MLSADLLKVAEDLLSAGQGAAGRPKQAHLRRAVSSVYYALFHCLAEQCANDFIGSVRGAQRMSSAWQQVYRSLDHKTAKEACRLCRKQPYNQKFPRAIQTYAGLFVDYQSKRHDADYDPYETFSKADVADMITEARQEMQHFQNTDARHRRAFSAFVLLGKPRR